MMEHDRERQDGLMQRELAPDAGPLTCPEWLVRVGPVKYDLWSISRIKFGNLSS
jgi:hypothetical protein